MRAIPILKIYRPREEAYYVSEEYCEAARLVSHKVFCFLISHLHRDNLPETIEDHLYPEYPVTGVLQGELEGVAPWT